MLLCLFWLKDDIPKEEQLPKPKPSNIIIEKEEPSDDSIEEELQEDQKTTVINKPIQSSKETKHNISFNANGGIGNMAAIECINSCVLPENTFTKEGYTFIGWSIKANGDILYKDKEELNNLSKNNVIIPLYAVWSINNYEISFLNYDGSIITKEELKYNDKIEFPEDPRRAGYHFIGWDTESKVVKEDIIITAIYEIDNYEISYNLNGGILEDNDLSYNIETPVSIPNPIKEGYNFIGWTTKEESTPIKDYEIPKGTVGNKEFTANYEALEYNLIYNTNGAKEELPPVKIKYDSNFGTLPTVTKIGYDFVNWTDKDNNNVSKDTIFKETNDINIYANWNAIPYNLTYNVNGGMIDDAPTSYNIETPVRIPNPIKEGYNFIGWATKEENTPIKDYEIPEGTIGDKELIANYEPISYNIVYNANEGEGNLSNSSFKYNELGTLNKNSFTREGYNFLGWATSKEGEVLYQDEAKVYNLSSIDKDTITLYAKWEIIKLNVKYYDLFGGLLKEEIVNYGDSSIRPEDPFLDGYTFTGWNSSNVVIKSDTIYQAEYSINDYTIRYNFNTGNENDITEIHYNVTSDKITLPIPERTGYTFIGWSGTDIQGKAASVVIDSGSFGNKEFKANWQSNNYIISLNANQGSVSPDKVEINYDSEYGILPEPQRNGYTFGGWYYEDEKIEESKLMNKNFNHELKARWKVVNYIISYDLVGGSFSSLIDSYNIETPTFSLPTPIKLGYTFAGWTGSNGNTPQKNVTITTGSTGNLSYTANWEINTFSITYDLNGGQASSLPSQYTLDTETFTLNQPSRSGYDFIGWTGSNGTIPQENVTISRGSTGNRTYTANWRKYNAVDYGGITIVSTRNGVTWEYNLDGHYNPGDTNVHSGNWIVTVSDYCVDIVGTKYPASPFTYQFYIYKANSSNVLLATGNASVLGNYQNNAKTKICW